MERQSLLQSTTNPFTFQSKHLNESDDPSSKDAYFFETAWKELSVTTSDIASGDMCVRALCAVKYWLDCSCTDWREWRIMLE